MALLKSLRLGDSRYNLNDYLRKSTGLVNNGNYGASGAKALDAAYGKTLNDTKYDKTGGELDGSIILVNEEFPTQTPANNAFHDYVIWKDSNNNTIGHLTAIFRPDGFRGVELGADRLVNGSMVYNTVYVGINENGEKEVLIGADEWRKALSKSNVNISGAICSGYITAGSKRIVLSVPNQLFSGGTFSLSRLQMSVRMATGGCPFARSGSGGGIFTQLGSSRVDIVTNGAAVRSNELDSFSVDPVQNFGYNVTLDFKYALTTNNSGTTVTNDIPISANLNIVGTIS